MNDSAERRRNYALRRRVDQLLGRVRAARAEIVERGLSAVHEPAAQEAEEPRATPASVRREAAPADERTP